MQLGKSNYSGKISEKPTSLREIFPPNGNLNTRRHLEIKKIKKKRRVFKGCKNDYRKIWICSNQVFRLHPV